MNTWTDEEISTIISLWPTHTVKQIANSLHRSRAAVRGRVQLLRKKGLLEGKKPRRNRSINPDPQDFDKAKRDYCWKHGIEFVKLCASLERDDQLATELYALAQMAKLARLRPRKDDSRGELPAG